ncbi:hypothetical protein [Mariniblastus fucicola]|uniref:Secreted protein n=1 Tax=Mariniblastus fucicola TaxID=980251 RepID=A0A5B9PEI5_9BACT|nr:hypothetical protein [Mariniblastus fucicola]QEG24654.1 hypothetical protein MFFC18_45750 [Mariniblastus fucicola]
MTRMFRIACVSIVIPASILFTSITTQAQQELAEKPTPPVDRLALLGEVYRGPVIVTPTTSNQPVPFSISTMSGDLVPPFAAHPLLEETQPTSAEEKVKFEKRSPSDVDDSEKVESIDDCCRELTEMIAGNLESEISLDAKKRMIETALKMVAQNVALKAEAKITKLKAEHALEMARMQGQMSQMRSMSNAAEQINQVAGPLNQMLQKNYQQAVAMNLGNQQLAQALAQLGYQGLENNSRLARNNRQRIQLTTPPEQNQNQARSEGQWRFEGLADQVSRLQMQLEALDSHKTNRVERAAYNQPLQPRRQPLEPMPSRQKNQYFNDNEYQSAPQWQR